MVRKEIGFPEDLQKSIQKYADENCEGNFNMAVRQLVKLSLLT